MHPGLKFLLDLGPLLIFFFANARFGIFAATGAFMVAIVFAAAVSYAMTRHLPPMMLVTAAVVLIFGGATLILHDELFIKLKPTIIYLLFAGVLFAGILLRKPFLAIVFDQMFNLTDEGWHKLTVRWAVFFLFLAALNEIVWRTQSTDFWVNFKVFGVLPLTMIFGAAQMPLLSRYGRDGDSDKAS
ncbi:MAG TPA: septation protein A [Pseudolabrys sp.]|nr:septation protein A [Pseudolabrys sp.]